MEERKEITMFKNKMLKKILGPENNEVAIWDTI
jgi:hypothetical protein